MHDLRYHREMVGPEEHVPRVFESSQEIQGFVEAEAHRTGWLRRPQAIIADPPNRADEIASIHGARPV